MRHYETIIILPPNLGDEGVETLTTGVEASLSEQFGAENLVANKWGKKNLAYPIRKFNEGYYILYEYDSDSDSCVSGIEGKLKLNENVMRFLTVRRDVELKTEAKMKERFAKHAKTPEAKNNGLDACAPGEVTGENRRSDG